MEIDDLLVPENVVAGFRASSKKQTLQTLSAQLSDYIGQDARLVCDAIIDREKLGSTGVGKGVAIPHARIDGLNKIVALFAHLAKPVDFDSVDDQPVDLVCMMLAPLDAGADHLKALALVSRMLRDDATCKKLRSADTSDTLYAMLAQPNAHAA